VSFQVRARVCLRQKLISDFEKGLDSDLSKPLVLLMGLLDRENIYDSYTIPEHDKECRIRVSDMHSTNPVTQMLNIPCSQRILKLNNVFFYDPPIFFRQIVNVLQYLPIYLEVQIASPRFEFPGIHRHYPYGQNRPPLQPSISGQYSPVVSVPAPAGQRHLHTALQVV
jgi:hypothetical protein